MDSVWIRLIVIGTGAIIGTKLARAWCDSEEEQAEKKDKE